MSSPYFGPDEGLTIYHGDCLDVLPTLDPVEAVVTDPPYGLEFMGRAWDKLRVVEDPATRGGFQDGAGGNPYSRSRISYGRSDPQQMQAWFTQHFSAIRDALKPGGHLLAFGGTRTHHRLMVGIEDAGFEIRDVIMWVYGSGFPKSHDVGKGIDKSKALAPTQFAADRDQVYRVTAWIRSARDAAGIRNAEIDSAFSFHGMAGHWTSSASQPSVPTLDQVPTLLAVLGNPIVPDEIATLLVELNGKKGQPGEAWFRREVIGHSTNQVGVGWVSNKQAGYKPEFDITAPSTDAAKQWNGWGTALKPAWEPIIVARKPLEGTLAQNVLAHGVGGLNIDGCRVGNTKNVPATMPRDRSGHGRYGAYKVHTGGAGQDPNVGRWPANLIHDGSDEVVGGMPDHAARFFYCAKADHADRNEGVTGRNTHPTVKPLALMRYLVRLVTPPGGTVCDPFMGSGSTGKAADLEGCHFIGIDADLASCTIAAQRRRAQRSLPWAVHA